VLGEHRGLAFYTLGQRHGLGSAAAAMRRIAWYVAAKDAARNALVVVQGHDHPLLWGRIAQGAVAALDRRPPPGGELRVRGVKTRYRQPDQPCTVAAPAYSLKILLENLLRTRTASTSPRDIEALATGTRRPSPTPRSPSRRRACAAGLHRRALRRRPGRDARRDGQARRRPERRSTR
jgi:hypothetical protein